eukprot:COSAG01_NODE_13029_length_1646_cov_2.350356_1_plen_130_part_00
MSLIAPGMLVACKELRESLLGASHRGAQCKDGDAAPRTGCCRRSRAAVLPRGCHRLPHGPCSAALVLAPMEGGDAGAPEGAGGKASKQQQALSATTRWPRMEMELTDSRKSQSAAEALAAASKSAKRVP